MCRLFQLPPPNAGDISLISMSPEFVASPGGRGDLSSYLSVGPGGSVQVGQLKPDGRQSP